LPAAAAKVFEPWRLVVTAAGDATDIPLHGRNTMRSIRRSMAYVSHPGDRARVLTIEPAP
jgi:hypothetical protein